MARKSQIVVALDIGTTTIKVVLGEVREDRSVDIIGVGLSPSQGLRKGVVINIEATVSAIARAITQAEEMAGREIVSVYASLSGSHLKGFTSNGIVGVRHREVSQLDIDKVIEAAKAVAIPLDRELLHVIPQEYVIDGQDGIKEPLGISGVRLESRVYIVTGATASAQNIVKCANRRGLHVNDLITSGLGSGQSVLSQEERELGVCVLDIGGGTTDFAVYHSGAIQRIGVIPVAGNHITNDIAAGLRTPVVAAEEIKREWGVALRRLVEGERKIDVASTGGRPPREISSPELAEIIEPRVLELFSMIERELSELPPEITPTSGVVLTGGSANLSGIVEAAEQILGLPVRIGEPQGVSGLTDLVRDPEYATAVGLIRYALEESTTKSGSNSGNKINGVFRNAVGWLGKHF